MRQWLPADLLAVMLGVSKRTVHRWAKADGWRTRGSWHDVEYSIEDAERSRHARRGVWCG